MDIEFEYEIDLCPMRVLERAFRIELISLEEIGVTPSCLQAQILSGGPSNSKRKAMPPIQSMRTN